MAKLALSSYASYSTRADNSVDGLGFSSPTMLELLWSGAPTDDTRVSIEKLSENMTHGIWTFPIAAILGSISIIACIDWINRKLMLTFTFCMLALVLAAAAGSFNVLSTSSSDGLHYILVIFWNLISFLFSFGPNTLTFIVSPLLLAITWRFIQRR
jgi:hypothetical protein